MRSKLRIEPTRAAERVLYLSLDIVWECRLRVSNRWNERRSHSDDGRHVVSGTP
jgi:hypothetical protein